MAVILFTLSKCLHTDRSFKLWYQFVLHVISLKVCVSGKTYANLCFVTLSTGGLKSVIKQSQFIDFYPGITNAH